MGYAFLRAKNVDLNIYEREYGIVHALPNVGKMPSPQER
jgi:hypothetical protein